MTNNKTETKQEKKLSPQEIKKLQEETQKKINKVIKK